MTLDEAIEHLFEKLNNEDWSCNKECKKDHMQLLNWLLELKRFRDAFNGIE